MTRRTCNPEPPGARLRPLVYIGHLAFFVLLAIAWIEHGARGMGIVAFLALLYGVGRDVRREMLLMREGRLRDPFDATRDDGRR